MSLQRQIKAYFVGKADVVVVYLFGSHAKGKNHSGSDVDVAVLFKKDTVVDFFERSLNMSCDLMKSLNVNRVDVIALNVATPVLKNQIFKSGVRILCNDPVEAVRFKARSCMEYLEIMPARKLCILNIRKKAMGHGR